MSVAAVELRKPYLIFVGDAACRPYAKTALGVRDWAPDACLAQCGLDGGLETLRLPEMDPEAAAKAGAKSLLIGVATVGGGIPAAWYDILQRAVAAGLDIISGMHTPLTSVPGLAEAAAKRGVALMDVRRPRQSFPIANGRKRGGKRVLMVGTDCTLGKKYTALALARAMQARGVKADFRATGQTGIMISGGGVAIDAVVADFIAGAVETLSPEAAPDHWDVIEGQGSLFHPSYAGVTLALVHGSQPDVLILCDEPTRKKIRSLPDFPIPPLNIAAARYLDAARLTNAKVALGGISLNTSALNDSERARVIAETADKMGVPCFDPIKSPMDAVVGNILALGAR